MSWVQHSIVLTFVFIYSVSGQQCESCTSVSNQTGCCVALQQCSYMYQALRNNRIDDSVRVHLRSSVCKMQGNVPFVCCENADDCTTVDDKPGACMPFPRCEPMLKLLESKPFLSQAVDNYMRNAECAVDSNDIVRVCCPIFYDTINL